MERFYPKTEIEKKLSKLMSKITKSLGMRAINKVSYTYTNNAIISISVNNNMLFSYNIDSKLFIEIETNSVYKEKVFLEKIANYL